MRYNAGHDHITEQNVPVPITTATATGRDPTTEHHDNAHLTKDWIAQYQKQATPKLIAQLCTYARTRALAVAAAGRKVDSMDALGDTWLGVVRWDPAKCSLAHHVARTIEGRADKHRKHAIDHPQDALGDAHEISRLAERDASEQVGGTADAFTHVYAKELLAQIRRLAGRDKQVLRVVEAYAAGCETREAVLAHAQMTIRTYQSAYARLRRLVRKLSDPRYDHGEQASTMTPACGELHDQDRERTGISLVRDRARVARGGRRGSLHDAHDGLRRVAA